MRERWDRLAPGCRQSAPDGGEVSVEECAEDGRACVRFTAPRGWRLERLAIHHRHRFDWLSLRKAADGIVLACRPDAIWEAHIVECKASVGMGAWEKVREQFRGSRIRLDAICGVLDIDLAQVMLYTAFRHDRMGLGSPDLALIDTMVGPPAPHDAGVDHAKAAAMAWRAPTITLPGFPPFPHRRVPLTVRDDTGYATVSLSP